MKIAPLYTHKQMNQRCNSVGNEVENDTFEGGWFTGRAPLTTIRMLLHDFTGIDLSAIREITLLLDNHQAARSSLAILKLFDRLVNWFQVAGFDAGHAPSKYEIGSYRCGLRL